MRLSLIVVFCGLILGSFAQKKKAVKKLGIRSVVSKDLIGSQILDDSKTIFNEKGKMIEEINYAKDGTLHSSKRYRYDKNGNLAMELDFDSINRISEIKRIRYNAIGLKTEEVFLDRDIHQKKKYTYVYNAKGLKISRKTYDALNKLIATRSYFYEFK